MDIDATDRRILRALQENADIPNTHLAEAVSLSPSACLRRVARLKNAGIIRKTVAVIDPATAGRPLTAVVTVEFTRHGSAHRRDFIERVHREAAIRQCYVVTGEVSCVLVMHLRDMDEYLRLADALFDQDHNVTAFRTYIVMHTVKEEIGVPF